MASPFLFNQPNNSFVPYNLQVCLFSSNVPKEKDGVPTASKENSNRNINRERMQIVTEIRGMDSPSSSSSDEDDVNVDLVMDSKPTCAPKSLILNSTSEKISFVQRLFPERNFDPNQPFLNSKSSSNMYNSSPRTSTPPKFFFAKPISPSLSDKFLKVEAKKKLKNFVKFQQQTNLKINTCLQRRKEKLRCPCTPHSPESENNNAASKHSFFCNFQTSSWIMLMFLKFLFYYKRMEIYIQIFFFEEMHLFIFIFQMQELLDFCSPIQRFSFRFWFNQSKN